MAAVAFATHDIVSVDGAESWYGGDVWDLDGDGDLDVVSGGIDPTGQSGNKIAWYENTDGKGKFGTQHVIDIVPDGPHSVHAADLDGDGDLDVLSGSYEYGKSRILWYENMDAKGTFGARRVINSANVVGSVYAADLDGDGGVDVLAAADDRVAWYENTDSKGTFGNQRVITTSSEVYVRSAYAADVDGDSDLDVLSASGTGVDGKIAWYENMDGKGKFGAQRVITTAVLNGKSVHAADVDGDGDMDVLSATYYDNKIAWYQNTDGKGTFSVQRVIDTDANAAFDVYTGDVDGDGDLDVLSAARFSDGTSDTKIAWYENTDGKGTFDADRVIARAGYNPHNAFVSAADLDQDGDLDVLSNGHPGTSIAWYENLSNPPVRKIGDSNGDGIFNSSDLIVVFQAGEYEDGVPQNSTFEEGDWNGDQEFDTKDLVLAFQAGTYVNAARPAARADIGSALVMDVGRGLPGIHHARTTQRTSERSSQSQSQPLAAAPRWDVAHVDRVFAEHAATGVRGISEMSNGTILDAMPGILDEAIL